MLRGSMEVAGGRQQSGRGGDDADTEIGVRLTNHRVFCGGLCVTGPKDELCVHVQPMMIGVFLLVLGAYIGPAVVFLGPHYPALVAMPPVFVVLTLVAYLLTACTEPGVVNAKPDMELEDQEASRRFCRVCNIAQDHTIYHCSYCNACIRELDHHCGIVGNCVGARNKTHFGMLLFYNIAAIWSLIAGFVFMGITQKIANDKDGAEVTLPPALDTAALVVVIVMAATAVASVTVYILAYFHCLGPLKPCIKTVCCQNPIMRATIEPVSNSLPLEPLCASLCSKRCLVPRREFYPTSSDYPESS